MTTVSIDFETRSTVDLKKCGVYVYAESPETEILCMAYAFGDEEPCLWVPEYPSRTLYRDHGDLIDHIEAGGALRAFNAQFERIIWRDILGPRYGFPVPDMEQWYCTAAEAMAMALPRSLGWCADVLNVPTPKDKEGRKLMLKMSKPGRDGTYHEDPEDLQRLYEYCKTDVIVEREVAKRIRRLSEKERQIYLMDQRANDRGVRLDSRLIDSCQVLVRQATRAANKRLQALTDGQITKVTQVQRMRSWLEEEQGVDTDDLRKHTVRDLLDEPEEIPDAAQELLEIRQEIGKTSAAKLKAMVRARCFDGYARGLLLYHGASTGRWSGKLLQPHNFPRGDVKKPEQYIDEVLMAPDVGWLREDPDPLSIVTSLLRACLVASPGHRIMAGDYSQIEARVLGWIAGEPYGENEYEKMAAAIYRVPVEEIIEEHARGDSERRTMGKNTVLGCGYQMGWKRYKEQAWERAGADVSEDLARRAVDTYRTTKPGIPQFWDDILSAAWEATTKPGKITYVGEGATIQFVVRGEFLWCVLPSGRPLAYAKPRVVERDTKWGPRLQLTYMGINSYTRKWTRLSTYGGHLTENVVQAMARDIMAEGMLRLDEAGYRPVLSVHDEVVCDTPNDHGSLEHFQTLLETVPSWAGGLSVASECWTGPRYRKG